MMLQKLTTINIRDVLNALKIRALIHISCQNHFWKINESKKNKKIHNRHRLLYMSFEYMSCEYMSLLMVFLRL